MHFLIKGVIVQGMGEGAFFMSMPHYKEQINKKLGFYAYPGTLNIKTNGSTDELDKAKSISIDGFKSGDKTFGGAKCYHASINEIQGAIIVPDLTKHKKNIVEFIAPVHIKTELKLKNGDNIQVEVK